MHRVLILTVVILAAARAEDDVLKKCMMSFHPKSHHCCKWDNPPKPPFTDPSAVKECIQLQGKPPFCEREICLAVKHGVATSDGKIDKEGLLKMIDTNFSDNPEFGKLMMDNCVDGDLSQFGEADICDPLKLKTCMHFAFIGSCPEWSDEGECAGLTDLAKECTEKLFG